MEKNLYRTDSLSDSELKALLSLAQKGKADRWQAYKSALQGKVVGLLFLNPSLRTRASFQSGIARLGGSVVALNAGTDSWSLEYREGALMNSDKPEHVSEAARVLSRYFDILGVRSFPQMNSWEEDREDPIMQAFLKHVEVPLINLESALWHPCQALADALTITELFRGNIRNKKFVLTWANHPKQLPMAVPNSTLLIASQLGINTTLCCPPGYELSEDVLSAVSSNLSRHDAEFNIVHSQAEAFEGADVVYAKSWTPPGYVGDFEAEMEIRKAIGPWTVTNELMSKTNHAYFMHCLPIRRNVIASDEVLNSNQCVIIDQAENRMHVQNAWLLKLMESFR